MSQMSNQFQLYVGTRENVRHNDTVFYDIMNCSFVHFPGSLAAFFYISNGNRHNLPDITYRRISLISIHPGNRPACRDMDLL